jgi:hypothetical protein
MVSRLFFIRQIERIHMFFWYTVWKSTSEIITQKLADVIVPSHHCLSLCSPDLLFTYSLLTMFVADMA